MKACLAAPSCQLVVMFRGPPASHAHRACPVMAQRTGNIVGAARLDAELRQTAKMEDVPRANWQGHRACSVMAVWAEGLGRRSNRLVPSADANRPTAKEREAV